jgi:ATP-dependent Clp protease ATP-binding subunit ClpC
MASFLFVGPTGVGKTETARALAEYFFGSRDRLLRLDMNQFFEAHTVARLLGAEPGYVGYEMGSPLLDFVAENPFCVVLLDEIEKAHADVHKVFLQIFDDGLSYRHARAAHLVRRYHYRDDLQSAPGGSGRLFA